MPRAMTSVHTKIPLRHRYHRCQFHLRTNNEKHLHTCKGHLFRVRKSAKILLRFSFILPWMQQTVTFLTRVSSARPKYSTHAHVLRKRWQHTDSFSVCQAVWIGLCRTVKLWLSALPCLSLVFVFIVCLLIKPHKITLTLLFVWTCPFCFLS